MKIFLTLALAFSFAVSFTAEVPESYAQDQKMSDAEMEMMKKWQAYATPGEAHQVLGQLEGDWDYTVKWWHAPGTEPQVSTGESDNEWILGGRFLEVEAEGDSGGMKFKGMGLMGYDNAKKQYVNVWIDNMGTGMMTGTGSYDAEKNQLTETGSYTDVMTGQDKNYRGVTTFVDKDNYTYELYTAGPDGNEFRMMEILYVREK